MSTLQRGRLTVDVVNDGPIEPVLDDLREALMRTGHGPRIRISDTPVTASDKALREVRALVMKEPPLTAALIVARLYPLLREAGLL